MILGIERVDYGRGSVDVCMSVCEIRECLMKLEYFDGSFEAKSVNTSLVLE